MRHRPSDFGIGGLMPSRIADVENGRGRDVMSTNHYDVIVIGGAVAGRSPGQLSCVGRRRSS